MLAAACIAVWLFSLPKVANLVLPDSPESVERGRYLTTAGGCISCHAGIDKPDTLSGGQALVSEFGTFYAPNITPDLKTGIGGWSAEDFLLALKHGRSPGGNFYYPAFPYRAYAGLSDDDVMSMAAYLMSLTPIEFTAPPHETPIWLWRWMLAGWNFIADFDHASPLNMPAPKVLRGAYLARNLGHCGECHTPRNALGIPDLSREYAGAVQGEDKIEAIDSQALKNWSEEDFSYFLFLGMKPDGEFVGGEMEKVIEHNTSKLTENDQQALAAFFKRN